MKLYLVQHGEAVSKEVDPDRPLTDTGKRDVEHVAQFLQQAGIHIDRVIHSGKLRAVQTADIIVEKLAAVMEMEISDSINPNDDPLAFDWNREAEGSNTMVVGHLPFMAKLVSHLLIGDLDRTIVAYQPGSIVCLEQIDFQWHLNWMIRPELIK